ncbi:MAG: anhydro-N-acetylmuramic acid kinase [Gammaproteobacteria bacterium]|nr:anhydro-N-acetylmuramic acid kinase [Gammaproteobacteria bacterium]
MRLYIGLISGTSMDAVDAVLVSFEENTPSLIAAHAQPIPQALRRDLLQLCHHGDLDQFGRLDIKVARLFAAAVTSLLAQAQLPASAITAIGSHGQTVRHRPAQSEPFTLQIGDPNTIAELTGITTVADFRRRDMAAGGQGAPLLPIFHDALLRHHSESRVVLNLGGIANITLLPSADDEAVSGFDTGPANTLLDAWAQRHLNSAHDINGAWAATGTVDDALLEQLLDDAYFRAPPPKSTGIEHFNIEWLEKRLDKHRQLGPQDVQRTLTELTATTVCQAIDQHATNARQVIVCGGGVHNSLLMERLAAHAQPRALCSSAKYGVDPDMMEAMAFAWLAQQRLSSTPINLPSITGASHPVVLGGIYAGA